MCFVLYVGTMEPISRKERNGSAPDISVVSLTERDRPIAGYFSKPEVQYIGSTSNCGCDFPHVSFQGGGWPWFEDGERDPDLESRERQNRQALVDLLRQTGEPTVELYGVWDGNFTVAPAAREQIALATILDPAFRLKERGFYVVQLTD